MVDWIVWGLSLHIIDINIRHRFGGCWKRYFTRCNGMKSIMSWLDNRNRYVPSRLLNARIIDLYVSFSDLRPLIQRICAASFDSNIIIERIMNVTRHVHIERWMNQNDQTSSHRCTKNENDLQTKRASIVRQRHVSRVIKLLNAVTIRSLASRLWSIECLARSEADTARLSCKREFFHAAVFPHRPAASQSLSHARWQLRYRKRNNLLSSCESTTRQGCKLRANGEA